MDVNEQKTEKETMNAEELDGGVQTPALKKEEPISQEEAIYRSVVDCVKDKDPGVLDIKIKKLESIRGYKDSEQLLEECFQKQIIVKKRIKRKKTLKKVALWVDIVVITLMACLCIWLCFLRNIF